MFSQHELDKPSPRGCHENSSRAPSISSAHVSGQRHQMTCSGALSSFSASFEYMYATLSTSIHVGILTYALMMLMLLTMVMQARGITMKSSSICLLHIPGTGSKPSEVKSFSAEDKLNRGMQTGMLVWHGLHPQNRLIYRWICEPFSDLKLGAELPSDVHMKPTRHLIPEANRRDLVLCP